MNLHLSHLQVGSDTPQVQAALDDPVTGSVHGRWVMFSGWVLADNDEPLSVTLNVDGTAVDSTPADLYRRDVADALQRPDSATCGFRLDVQLPLKEGIVTLVAAGKTAQATIAVLAFAPTTERLTELRIRSQSGEEAVLARLIDERVPRVVVDVGSHDGVMLSNSYDLLAQGWRGILIEPLPSIFDRLVLNHRRHPLATCLNVACSDTDGAVRRARRSNRAELNAMRRRQRVDEERAVERIGHRSRSTTLSVARRTWPL
jgi:FkbM family methyltransferase